MIPINNHFTPLAFVNNLNEQDYRLSYAFGEIYPLIVPSDRLLPFQIIRPHKDNFNHIEIGLIDANTGTFVADLTTEMAVIIKAYLDYDIDVMIYRANANLHTILEEGRYYLDITDGEDNWYSQVFTICKDVSQCLKIEWWDNQDVYMDSGIITYSSPNYRNILYLCTELGKPDYQFEEEGENRDGYFFPEKQLSWKVYKATTTATEYLCDAMRFIRMSDNVRITDKYGRTYKADTFLITPKWQTQGNIASVDIEFTTDTICKKLAKGYPI